MSSWGRYVPTYVDPDSAWQRTVEAAALLPDGGAVTGWAALNWSGSRWFVGLGPDGKTPLPIPLAIGHDRVIRRRPGMRASEEWLAAGDIETIDGLPLTVAARSVCYEMRRTTSLAAAVTVASMAAFSDHAALDDVAEYAAVHLAGRPWTRKIHRALPHCDENCWSPREAAMLVAWTVEGGFPRPLCNPPIFAPDGTHLLTPDFFDPEHGVVGEYDSLIHIEDGRRVRDVNREELARDLGLELVTMVTTDNADREPFLRRLGSAYRRAAGRRRTSSWTLTQPDWWVDTSTVAKRRALSPEHRARWLKRQAA